MQYKEININLTDDEIAIKNNVHKFAIEVLRPASIELDKLSPENVIKKDSIFWSTLKQAYAMGLHTFLLPESYGGLGLSPLAVHIVEEELAYGSIDFAVALGVATFPAFISMLAPTDYLIENFIYPYTKDKEAKFIGCWAITQPNRGSDTLAAGTDQFKDPNIKGEIAAKLDGNEWLVNGTTSAWVSCGTIATHAAVFLNIDPSMGMAGGGICIIPTDLSGVSKGKPLNKMGQRALNQGEIIFDNVRVPKDNMIIDQEAYEAMTDITLAAANGSMGAFLTGVARAAYEEALNYARQRVQGGKLLIEHEFIRHKLLHMFKLVEAARAFSRNVLVYNLTNSPPDTKYSIASKIFCTEAAFKVANEASMIFGGYGVAKEYYVEKLLRDARASLIEDGSNDSLAIFAGELIEKSEE
ncbi:MAG: acyl-CoA/acyl-ACP dehydrogenase [Deltaproteobacteria bacterium]|nr:acyl-CoA/acyl-ACP dehydrogenase [Deltaproteobacteria bacterium]MCL5792091.1 acyl-CoA/acyl-ACP dehydrogenase [Deltaproteobacteria bacterium]